MYEQRSFVAVVLLVAAVWPHALCPANGAQYQLAVVNDVPAHYEVLAGVLYTLRPYRDVTKAFVAGDPAEADRLGLSTWLGSDAATTLHPLRALSPSSSDRATALICISPELSPTACKSAVAALRPSALLAFLHRGDTLTPRSRVLSLHPNTTLLALAPHVAHYLSQRLRRDDIGWALPVVPYRGPPSAAAVDMAAAGGSPRPAAAAAAANILRLQPPPPLCTRRACLSGFAVQGTLRRFKNKGGSGFIRNYTRLFEDVLLIKQQQQQQQQGGGSGISSTAVGSSSNSTSIKLLIIGKADPAAAAALAPPRGLEGDVSYLLGAPYPQFWAAIQCSLALVPAFGMDAYLSSRISSSISASLSSLTPLIAGDDLLAAYSFLTPDHVFMRRPGESEAQAMGRILAMSEEEILSKRAALAELRQTLEARSRDVLERALDLNPFE